MIKVSTTKAGRGFIERRGLSFRDSVGSIEQGLKQEATFRIPSLSNRV
jgi:hypothetical protein